MNAKISGEAAHTHTTKRREWWGWFGSLSWLFLMRYGYYTFAISETGHREIKIFIPFCFMAVFAFSIAAFGLRFGNNPGGLSRIAFFATPAAIAITAVFALLPEIPGAILYIISPVLFAPAITRRVYGILHTTQQKNKLTQYMSGIAACVIVFAAWRIIGPPKEIAFAVPALLAIPAWIGVRRDIAAPEKMPPGSAFRISKRTILLFFATMIVLFWLDAMNAIIHSNIIHAGIYEENLLYFILGFCLPSIGFLLYGIINDKGHERLGVIIGMGLSLIGIILALTPANENAILIPLAVTDGLGGTYTEFFILTIPIFLLAGTKRPVFVSSLGVFVNLVSSAVMWAGGVWIPESLQKLDVPLYISAALSSVVFIILVFIIFERHKEKTFASALYALLRGGIEAPPDDDGSSQEAEKQRMEDAKLSREEIEFALLLIEGKSRSEVIRKLRIKSAEANKQMESIRNKLIGANDPYPNMTAIANRYGLTGREKDMLACLQRDMTNPEIAAEMFLSEGTVKIHVRNLLKKLPVEGRRDVAPWANAFETEAKN
ncbi:MAG: LuxR C-terminal-related transcriptional regulator [Oscillospiraceae bacterium]|nr:LuxR C-terminal-related transcriptional regulator [Oscillospiraceae bacterium]